MFEFHAKKQKSFILVYHIYDTLVSSDQVKLLQLAKLSSERKKYLLKTSKIYTLVQNKNRNYLRNLKQNILQIIGLWNYLFILLTLLDFISKLLLLRPFFNTLQQVNSCRIILWGHFCLEQRAWVFTVTHDKFAWITEPGWNILSDKIK